MKRLSLPLQVKAVVAALLCSAVAWVGLDLWQSRRLAAVVEGKTAAVPHEKVAVAMLARLGCTVEVAENGREAVARFRDGEFDLVLMDCQMPEMNGLEAARAIRRMEADQQLPATPIVAMTANVGHADRTACIKAGMNGHLPKPIDKQRLREVVAGIACTAAG